MPLVPRDHPTHTCALVSCTLSSEVPKPLQSAPAKPCGLKFFWGSMPPHPLAGTLCTQVSLIGPPIPFHLPTLLPISNYVVYGVLMAVGMGILYNSGDFPILYFVLLAINVCL